MRALLYIILLIIANELFLYPSTIAAEEQTKPIIINTFEEDLTGDGIKEVIVLKGIILSSDTKYYRDIWVDIQDTHTRQQWKVPYGGGYEPTLKFIDLNNDQIPDLFFQSLIDIDGDHYNYHMHTLNKERIKKIAQPEQWHIDGKFKDNFIIDLTILHNENPISIPIKDQQSKYVQLGIYNNHGKLMEPTSARIDPISKIQPIFINKDKNYGIRTIQKVYGSKTHHLGSVDTLWYYENKKWIILRTKWRLSR